MADRLPAPPPPPRDPEAEILAAARRALDEAARRLREGA